jgi:hypothetical protein
MQLQIITASASKTHKTFSADLWVLLAQYEFQMTPLGAALHIM